MLRDALSLLLLPVALVALGAYGCMIWLHFTAPERTPSPEEMEEHDAAMAEWLAGRGRR